MLPNVAQGDEKAFEMCIDRYRSLVWSLATRYFDSRADLEDCVQDVFMCLWENAEAFDPARAPESAFVRTIARRRVIDRVRARSRRDHHAERLNRARAPEPDALPPEERQDAVNAMRALAALPGDRRTVLWLAIQDHSHSEIAETTGFPIGTVKSHFRRGIQTVRHLLQEPTAA